MIAVAKKLYLPLIGFCLTTAVIAAMAIPASAQLTRMLGNSRLTPEDIEIATETAKQLFSKPGVRVGETAQWSNEETGARGVVLITKVDQGGACVSFRHTTEAGVQQLTQSASRRCRAADGTWVLTPE